MDKHVGEVILVALPNTKRPQYRWIVRIREDGRYIARVPKIGVLIRELHLKRDDDYGLEVLLPVDSKPHETAGNRKSNKRLLLQKRVDRKQGDLLQNKTKRKK